MEVRTGQDDNEKNKKLALNLSTKANDNDKDTTD
jgi:hypothetical protein